MLRYIRGEPKNNNFRGRLKVIDKFAYTISTKQVRIPNSGIIDLSNGKYGYLTERECFRLMVLMMKTLINSKLYIQEEKVNYRQYFINKLEIALS